MKNIYASLCQHLELWVAIPRLGSIILPWFFDNIWSVFNALSVCVTWFLIQILQFLPNIKHMVSHGLNPLGLRFNGLYFKATRNWHVKHWFSHCRRNVASFKCKNNFLTRRRGGGGGEEGIFKKVFGSRTFMMKTAWNRKNSIENFPAKKFRDFRVITMALSASPREI